ncbi:tryptophan-rich sensory protein [Frigoribacterium sp. CFBP 8766]|uniref:tryptophan-rich sensory protein n=1 Tax=Frigoribacterium sp. CFBP 8766 TaxID=2775273 RepID=UPI0017860111|nr:tryptophan-rich sensory protein [Frigoribacterium sp. CFBP 8766]MBD8585755.1 tryptophan-rich sensory protein [Frigoribacterium sp. CFBP 8766]
MSTAATRPASATAPPASVDVVRQVVVVVGAVLAIVLAAIGSGAFGGTSVSGASGGALSADATPIAPATTAFSIWSVIYAGLVAYAVYQALPGQRAVDRHRRLGYWVAASMLLNAGWLFAAVQLGQVWLSVVVIVALLAVLVRIFLLVVHTPTRSRVDAVVTDGTMGLYLGWVSVATAANIAAALVESGFGGFGLPSGLWSTLVLAVAGLSGVAVAVVGRGRIAPMLSLVWGLAWVAVGRFSGQPLDIAAGVTALVAAAVVLVVVLVLRVRADRSGSALAPGEPTRAS